MDKKPFPPVKKEDPTPKSHQKPSSPVAVTKKPNPRSVETPSNQEPKNHKIQEDIKPTSEKTSIVIEKSSEELTSERNAILEGQTNKTIKNELENTSSNDDTNSTVKERLDVINITDVNTQKQHKPVDTDTADIVHLENKEVENTEQVEKSHSEVALESETTNNNTEVNRSEVSDKIQENEPELINNTEENESEVSNIITENESEVSNKTLQNESKVSNKTKENESEVSNKTDENVSYQAKENESEVSNQTKETDSEFDIIREASNEMDDDTSEKSNNKYEDDTEVCAETKDNFKTTFKTTPNQDYQKCKGNKIQETQLQLQTCANNKTEISSSNDTNEIKQNQSTEDLKPEQQFKSLEAQCNPSEESMEIQLEIHSMDEKDEVDNDLESEIKASSESEKRT